jgi:flagellar hook-associated protein 1 FlgK
VLGLGARRTVSGLQGDGLALNLFVDAAGADFTDSLDGGAQQAGFAARIRVNPAIAADNRLLVQYEAGGALGDAARANRLLDRLTGLAFADATGSDLDRSSFRFAGTVGDLVMQVMNRQGEIAALANDGRDTQNLAMEALSQRLEAEYGVDVDAEMARLMELQTAYAANARVLSAVQALLDTLLRM